MNQCTISAVFESMQAYSIIEGLWSWEIMRGVDGDNIRICSLYRLSKVAKQG